MTAGDAGFDESCQIASTFTTADRADHPLSDELNQRTSPLMA
jgi:hypothetical protein